MALHINQVRDIVRILTANGTTNQEEQAIILGYIIGLEAPISLNQNNPDDDIEWNSFLKDLAGQVNEHFLINTSLAQDVANCTLAYRQSVMNADEKLELWAERFLKLTGSSFGMLGNPGTIKQIRKVILGHSAEFRQVVEERREAEREAQGELRR